MGDFFTFLAEDRAVLRKLIIAGRDKLPPREREIAQTILKRLNDRDKSPLLKRMKKKGRIRHTGY